MPSGGGGVSTVKSAFSWLINTMLLYLGYRRASAALSYESFARHSETTAGEVGSNPGSAPCESSRFNGPPKTGSGKSRDCKPYRGRKRKG